MLIADDHRQKKIFSKELKWPEKLKFWPEIGQFRDQFSTQLGSFHKFSS